MKKIVLLIFICIAAIKIKAQTVINDPIQAAMDTMYSKLDTNYIPYKMLLEKAYLNSSLTFYNGVLDSVADFTEIYTAAEDLQYMYVGKSNPYFNLTGKIQNDINNYRSGSGGVIPLSIVDFMFGGIDSNAFEQNKLKFDGYYVKDIFPRTGSPYVTDRTLVFSPAINNGGMQRNFTFILKNEHIYKNNTNTNYEFGVRVNFGDGLGYRTIALNQPISVNFPTSAKGRQIIILDVEARDANNVISRIKAYSYFDLDENSIPANVSFNLSDDECPQNLTSFMITSDLKPKGFNYEPGNRGLVTVQYGIDPATGQRRNCVKKPIIFVEGIDFRNKGQLEEGYDSRFGKCNGLGFFDFFYQKELIDEKWVPMAADHPFFLVKSMMEELNNKGYDFIYLDFEKGADYMQKNALVVIKLIQRINGLKSKNVSCEPNIVVGASMGGQVVKYALSMMEYYKLEHDSKLYVSFDSPHLGANIPIGFQLMADFFSTAQRFSGLTIKAAKEDSKMAVDAKLSRPATKQLLTYHYAVMGTDPLRTAFLNELNTYGDFPTETFNFGIVNGSGQMGIPTFSSLGFNPGDRLFSYEITIQDVMQKILYMYTPKKYIGKKIKNFLSNIIGNPGFLNGAIMNSPLGSVIQTIEVSVSTSSSSTKIFANNTNQTVFSFKPFYVRDIYETRKTAPGAPLIDHVAGCLRSDIAELVPRWNKEWQNKITSLVVTAHNHKFFSFMPTPSTLAWKASTYNVAVNTKMKDYVSNMDPTSANLNTKFNLITMPDTNEAHVRVTTANNFDFQKVVNNSASFVSQNIQQLPNSIGSQFKHNQSQGNELFLTTLNTGASYLINKAATSGGYNQFENIYYPGTFNIYNRACNNVTINNGALMEIYGYSNQNTNLNIVSGTQMILNAGAILNIYNNASLVIKSGAKLVLNASSQVTLNGGVIKIEEGGVLEYNGGTINLNSSQACLNFKGNLNVASNTIFAPAINGGYLLFDGVLSNYQNQISSLNAKIKIAAVNKNDLVLKIDQPDVFIKSNQLIEISKGTIEFAKTQSRLLIDAPSIEFAKTQSRLLIDAPSLVKDIQLTQSSNLPLRSANGLQVYYKTGSSTFSNISAYNLNQALTINGNVSLKPIFTEIYLENCNYGLVAYNGGVQISSSSFIKNSNALLLNPLTVSSSISSSLFQDNYSGINYKGASSLPVKFTSNNFTSNAYALTISSGTNTSLRCNTFTNNNYPVLAKGESTLDLRAGYNSFVNNIDYYTLIVLDKAKDILLENGYNNFINSESNTCLNGTCKFLISGTIIKTTNPCQVIANNNSYKNLGTVITNANLNKLFYVTNANCGRVNFSDASPKTWPISCGQYDLGGRLMDETALNSVYDYFDLCTTTLNSEAESYVFSNPLLCMENDFSESSNISAVQLEKTEWEVWPNPIKNNDVLKIKFLNTNETERRILIYDMLGKLIFEEKMINDKELFQINEKASKGLYLLKIEEQGTIKFTTKLVVE